MRFARVWRCQSCGKKLPDGTLLDCDRCQRMLDEAFDRARGVPLVGVRVADVAARLEAIAPSSPVAA